ncbi:MAG TPA: glycosyltransferase family 1 protein [Opitutaceae bacterium]|jgi:glycosyltransferase involved in cell wall biosynthesis|nr:glycosyltransferase family 1 protein [Opitutaceae bacterium]
MRIGLSTSVMQRGQSGVGQYVLSLVRALLDQAHRHDFTLFVLEEDLPLFAFASTAMNLVSVAERFRPPISNIFWHQFHLPRLVRRLQLDVLHVPSYRRLLWPHPCALVATLHDLAPFRVPRKYNLPRMLYGRIIVRWLARRQDEIIAVSQFTADDIDAFFALPLRQRRVIHNGLDHERFRPGSRVTAKAAVARNHGLHQPFFLYVARLEHPAKNHARLIAAFNRFKAETGSSWQLVLGGSDWHGAEVVHELIRQSAFAADIRPLGFVPAPELPVLYRAADLFVFPSLFEGFGLPPVEAMACGCPVLASRRGALGEVIGSDAAILDPENIADIQAQLTFLAGNAHAREKLRSRGFLRAAQFDWQRTALATLQTYADAAAKNKWPPSVTTAAFASLAEANAQRERMGSFAG